MYASSDILMYASRDIDVYLYLSILCVYICIDNILSHAFVCGSKQMSVSGCPLSLRKESVGLDCATQPIPTLRFGEVSWLEEEEGGIYFPKF